VRITQTAREASEKPAPHRTFVNGATNGGKEPVADMISCVVFARAEILTRQERPRTAVHTAKACCTAASPKRTLVSHAAFSGQVMAENAGNHNIGTSKFPERRYDRASNNCVKNNGLDAKWEC